MNIMPGSTSRGSVATSLSSSDGTIAGWVKVTKTFADFSDAGTVKQIALYTLPVGSILIAVKCKHSTAFTGGGATMADMRVGLNDTTLYAIGRFVAGCDVFRAAADEAYTLSFPFRGNDHGATEAVTATLDSDVALNTLAAGSCDFWLWYGTAV